MADLYGRTPEPPPRVLIESVLRAAAGSTTAAQVMVTNAAPTPRVLALTVVGVDQAWLSGPRRTRALGPAESALVELTFTPAPGTVAARYPLALAVQAIHPDTGASTSPTTLVDLVLVVDAPGQVSLELSPADVEAVFGKRFTVTVTNSGASAARVELEARSADGAEVRLERRDVEIPPGSTARVRGRARASRPRLLGHRARRTFSVTARTAGAPRSAAGSITQRPVVGASGTKLAALLALVAIWAALAVVLIPKLSKTVRDHQAGAQTATTTAAPGSGGAGASSTRASASGAAGVRSRAAAKAAAKARAAAAGSSTVQLNGTVTGVSPNKVTVSLRPTSLVDEAAQGADAIGFSPTVLDENGLVAQSSMLLTAPSVVSPKRATRTGTDGTWSLPKIKKPGYYLLVFAKPGYQTQRYVVDSSAPVAAQPMGVNLVAGQGSLRGAVTGPGGPVGGAHVSITDGTNTITTSSNTVGTAIGAWSVTGLSTPGTYLVTVSADALGAQSMLVSLPAGGSAVADLRLESGAASLQGLVQGDDSTGAMVGLGGVTVSATDGRTTRTATTVTNGPVGRYVLPDLPAPGRYTVTVTATGYQSQTQRVTLRAGQSVVTVGAVLTSSSASITGRVTGDQLDGNGDPTGVTEVKAGAGLVLTSPDHGYKITSTSNGTFRLNGVAPGVYDVSAAYAGLLTGHGTVTATAGHTATVATFDLRAAGTSSDSTIEGFVSNSSDPSGTICAGVSGCRIIFTLVDALGQTVAITPASQTPSTSGPTSYTLSALSTVADPVPGLQPGLYHLTIAVTVPSTSTLGYLAATVTVQVPLNGVGHAPQVDLTQANTISGTLTALGTLYLDSQGHAHVNCVVAVPVGQAPITSCDAQPDTTPCSKQGKPSPALAIVHAPGDLPASAALNSYAISGLCDGSYVVTVIITNPEYDSPGPDAQETVSNGQTVNYSPAVPRKGRVVLTLESLDSNGNPSPAPPGVAGTAECHGGTSTPNPISQITFSSPVDGQVTVSGIDASSDVSCTVKDTSDGLSGVVTGLGVTDNQDTSATMILTQTLGAFAGVVSSNAINLATDPFAGAQVTITGTAKDPTTGVVSSQSASAVTNSSGCFGLQTDDVVPTAPAGCAALDSASIVSLGLVSANISVQIVPAAGSGYDTLNQTVALGGGTLSFTLIPTPIAFSASLAGSPDPNDATVTASATSAPGSGSVTVSNNAGVLTWNDTNYAGPGAWPGTYSITVAEPGFHSATGTVTCVMPLSTSAGATACVVDLNLGQIVQLGAVTGTLTGILDVDPAATSPTTDLTGATVTLTSPDGKTVLTTQTDGSGVYNFGGTTAPYSLTPGDWTLSALYFGYSGGPTTVTVGSGPSTDDRRNLALHINPTTLQIGLEPSNIVIVGTPKPGQLVTTASIYLQRVDTGQLTLVTVVDPTTHLYVFPDLLPTTYNVYVFGPKIATLITQLTVPLSANPTGGVSTQYLTVSVSHNTATGTVDAVQGAGTAPTGLNGAWVEIGTYSGTAFTVGTGTDGLPMSMATAATAGVPGTFSFSDVPDGNWAVRYNDSDTASNNLPGYEPLAGTTIVSVNNGQAASFGTVVLTRVTHTITVSLTDTNGFPVSGLQADLKPGDPNPTESPVPFVVVSGPTPHSATVTYAATFNSIPFGTWTVGVNGLPVDHFGVIEDSGGNAVDDTDRVTVTVPDTAAGHDPSVPLSLDEGELDLSVVSAPLGLDPTPAGKPATVDLSIGTVYENKTFAVDGGAAVPIWVTPGKFAVTLDSGVGNWVRGSAASITVADAATQKAGLGTVTLTELGGTVVVTVVDAAKKAQAGDVVILVPPPGTTFDGTDPTKAPKTDTKGQVTFTDVPWSPGWTASTTIGTGAKAVTYTSKPFTVSATDAKATITVG